MSEELDLLLDISEVRPLLELSELCTCHIYFHCPHCGEVVVMPVRDEASIKHCEEVGVMDHWMKDVFSDSDSGSVTNSRMGKCIHCGKIIWCSDKYTTVTGESPSLRKADPATLQELVKMVMRNDGGFLHSILGISDRQEKPPPEETE